jgi:plasmid stabilization system protein ParE
MAFVVMFKPLAEQEVAEAFNWYAQPHIAMEDAYLTELDRTAHFIAHNPFLYPHAEGEMRQANLNRFPYALFYVIDGDTVNVLSCFHHHRDPKSRNHLH